MRVFRPCISLLSLVALCASFMPVAHAELPTDKWGLQEFELFTSDNLEDAKEETLPRLKRKLAAKNMVYGKPVFIRIFKESRELEMWIQKNEEFELFRTYPICEMSGRIGPKLEQGDDQAPEGFYWVNEGWMHPKSSFHLAMNVGYPNAYDKEHNRTGSAIMIHGECSSSGCFAMTDDYIEEIYLLSEAALIAGQPFFRVQIFPFRMTDANMKRHKGYRWYSFWENLKEGYDFFEAHKRPANAEVLDGRYVFNDSNEPPPLFAIASAAEEEEAKEAKKIGID
jgi:murein L,D-transpeptidase YafK